MKPAPFVAWSFFLFSLSGCFSAGIAPYPYPQWDRPVRSTDGRCVSIAGVYDLTKSECAMGPRPGFSWGEGPAKRITVTILGKQAFRNEEYTQANAIRAQRMEIIQEDCASVTGCLQGKDGRRSFIVSAAETLAH